MALKIKTFFFEKRLAFFLSLALVACVGLLPLSSDAPCLAVLPLCRGHRPCCVCAALHLQRQPPLPFTQQHVICSVFHGQDVVTVTAIRCSVSSAFLLSNKLPEEGGRRWRLPVTSLPPSLIKGSRHWVAAANVGVDLNVPPPLSRQPHQR